MKVKEMIFLVEDDPEGGYNARALGHSIFTQADTREELKENITDAIKCHFDSPNIEGMKTLYQYYSYNESGGGGGY
jgi:dephospho-CoA kinase